jgi:hypothetical protein
VIRWSGGHPSAFLKDVMQGNASPVQYGREIDRQSRMLALIDVPTAAGRERLAAELSAEIAADSEALDAENPLLLHALTMTLAATGTPTAATTLERFFGQSALDRDPLYWDAFTAGATMRPAAFKSLLERASRHPLRTIRMRARDALAVAGGDLKALRHPTDAAPELPPEVASIAEQLRNAATMEDAQLVLSRQRSLLAAELALALSDSPGAAGLLEARIDRGDRVRAAAQWLLIANQPGPLESRRYEGMLRRGANHNIHEPATMLALVAHEQDDHRRFRTDLRWQAIGPHFGRSSPPLLHRATALYALSRLERENAEPALVDEFLDVIDRDPSAFVRMHAAIAAVRAARPGDGARIASRIERSKHWDPEVKAALLMAAGKPE